MRGLLTLLIFIPLAIGTLVGFIVSPFVIGFMIAYEFLSAHVDGAYLRMEAKRKAREQSATDA